MNNTSSKQVAEWSRATGEPLNEAAREQERDEKHTRRLLRHMGHARPEPKPRNYV